MILGSMTLGIGILGTIEDGMAAGTIRGITMAGMAVHTIIILMTITHSDMAADGCMHLETQPTLGEIKQGWGFPAVCQALEEAICPGLHHYPPEAEIQCLPLLQGLLASQECPVRLFKGSQGHPALGQPRHQGGRTTGQRQEEGRASLQFQGHLRAHQGYLAVAAATIWADLPQVQALAATADTRPAEVPAPQ